MSSAWHKVQKVLAIINIPIYLKCFYDIITADKKQVLND